MSFHHILASNVTPKDFPNNHASSFSTPIYNPYDLKGKWEVALTNLTHSSCIYTFNNESYEIYDSSITPDLLPRLEKDYKINISFPTGELIPSERIAYIQNLVNNHDLLKHVLRLKRVSDGYLRWIVTNPNIILIISRDLQIAFRLYSQVITSEDEWPINYFVMDSVQRIRDAHIIIIRKDKFTEKIMMKEMNKEMNLNDLLITFNEKMKGVAKLTFKEDTIYLKKLYDDNIVVLPSKALSRMFGFRQVGSLYPDEAHFSSYTWPETYEKAWYVRLYRLRPDDANSALHTFHLARKPFATRDEACAYLNQLDPRVSFSCNAQNIVTMEIKKPTVKVRLDNDLRDILAFTSNEYKGKGKVIASDVFSLIRRIHYLYVYSNISDLLRVGDTQAPLLAILPFNAKDCEPHRERTFRNPMYIPLVRDYISQIDIEIRDDAGQLVPFHDDALTTLRLHFRKA